MGSIHKQVWNANWGFLCLKSLFDHILVNTCKMYDLQKLKCPVSSYNATFLCCISMHSLSFLWTVSHKLTCTTATGTSWSTFIYICRYRYSTPNLQASALLLPKGRCVSDEGDVELGRYRGEGFGEIWSRSFRVHPYLFACHLQDNLQMQKTNK